MARRRLTSQMAVQINEIHSMWKAGSETTLTTSTNSPNDPDFVKNNDKSNSLRTQNFLSLSTTHSFNTPSCGFSCGCVCHRQLCSYYDAGLLGSLFLAPELPFFASSSCTERKCRGKATSNVRFTYYFPSWYLRKAITILYNGNGPQFSVRFANIIPENHDLFGCAKTGDVKKLKLLLTSGQSSPTDIDHDGDGLLICTLELKEFSLEMCNFVYSLPGVDPLATNRFGQSFVSIAWQLILSMEPETRHTDPLASWLVSVITKYDYFEERQFKTLHKIVTDCSTIPLLSQLDTSTAEIDDPDASGWTPLMWATFRHNAKAMQNLLDYEADANLLNKEGQHALHLGAWSWNPKKTDISLEVAAWERLVSKIPEVDLIDRYKWTPLMYASRTARNVPLLEALIDAGADVNLPGHAGITPLHWAAQVDRCDAVKYLVQVGAKLDAVTLEDKTPLHLAASNNAHGSLQALLDLGAGAAEVLCNGRAESLLFEAAHSADLKTLTLLAQADLPEVDLASVKDEDGRTLQEAFDESRAESLDAEVAAAWELFIESLSVLWHDAVDGEPSFQAGVQTADEHLKVEKIAYE